MTVRLAPLLLVALAHALPAPARAEQWFALYLEGQKIGQARVERELRDDLVHTRQRLEIALERGGVRIGVVTEEESVETEDGRPVALAGLTEFSGQAARRYRGEIRDGRLSLELDGPLGSERRELPWPGQALLAEGQRLALRRLRPGESLSLAVFVGDLLEAVTVRFEAVGEEAVELPELGPVRLLRVEQTMELPRQRLASTLWLDDRGQPRRMRMPLLGSAIDMLACSRACATAPNRVEALFDRALAQAPAGTGALDRRRAWRYRVQAADGEGLDFPSTAEQRARREGETWTIVVRPGESAFGEPKPTAAERSASRWLESDHPELRRFAKAAAGDASGDAERMRRLERAVAEHIREKSLAVGYASALETLRARAGDCTEHALLLAAAGRALGIPTRVATGLVYSPAFGEAREVFVPHAWTQAWIGGRWVSFDAAQRGFGGGHLLLAVGDGDPWRFAEGIAQLGRLRLLAVESLPRPGRAATPEAKL